MPENRWELAGKGGIYWEKAGFIGKIYERVLTQGVIFEGAFGLLFLC